MITCDICGCDQNVARHSVLLTPDDVIRYGQSRAADIDLCRTCRADMSVQLHNQIAVAIVTARMQRKGGAQ